MFLLGAAQAHERSGRGEEPDRYALRAGESADRDREVAFAAPDRPVEHEVLALVDEFEALELGSSPVGGHSQVGPVVAVEGLVRGESGLFQEARAFGLLA